ATTSIPVIREVSSQGGRNVVEQSAAALEGEVREAETDDNINVERSNSQDDSRPLSRPARNPNRPNLPSIPTASAGIVISTGDNSSPNPASSPARPVNSSHSSSGGAALTAGGGGTGRAREQAAITPGRGSSTGRATSRSGTPSSTTTTPLTLPIQPRSDAGSRMGSRAPSMQGSSQPPSVSHSMTHHGSTSAYHASSARSQHHAG
ncbi:unnamed protein product, partial [Amoebophrya sp. A25]